MLQRKDGGKRHLEKLGGWFTLESNLVGLTLEEMETRLGFQSGRLTDQGARILLLVEQPKMSQVLFGGSTFHSNAEGLVEPGQRRLFSIPGAWWNRRLVKVVPIRPEAPGEAYPHVRNGQGPAEQWRLVEKVAMEEVCRLQVGQEYWPGR